VDGDGAGFGGEARALVCLANGVSMVRLSYQEQSHKMPEWLKGADHQGNQ
jgi:hypothetical protein